METINMKLKISNIDESAFTVREKLDSEYLVELKESLKNDGQWDPILVRPGHDGKYELISGHNRVQAAKEIGWSEIDATIKDLNNVDAMFLSLKTNLIRQDMTQIEQGKILRDIMNKTNHSGVHIAKNIGKSQSWVNRRIQLALDLHADVTNAISKGSISNQIALILSTVEKTAQPALLNIFKSKNINNEEDARTERDRFLNNTIFTIGYESKIIKEFLESLQNNGIKQLIDVRFSAESKFKPDFNKVILARELERVKIKYTHRSDLGIPYQTAI